MKTLMTLVTIALVVAMAPMAMAQQTATVTGTVADASGALIPGVGVDATNTNTNITRSAVSGEAGSYTLQALQPGPYNIVASLPGFADARIEVNLTPNQTFRFDFVMQVAGTATQIEVISDADALLATTSSSVGDALPAYEIEALPLATRDIFDLLSTTAGVVRTEDGNAQQFAGTRNSAVNTTRDGITVSDGRYLDWNGAYSATFTSSDLVEEVQISVGTVDPAAGRGSGQVRLQTRSGTNEYHGALFYSTNNSAFNANSWFNNRDGNELDWTNRQQFGGRLGGPIIEDRAFFFVLLDEQRYNERTNETGFVWTPQARQGIFRYWPGYQNQNAATTAIRSVDESGAPTPPPGLSASDLVSVNLFNIPATFNGVNVINGTTTPSLANDPRRGTGITQNGYIQETLSRMPLPNNYRVGDGLNTAGVDWVHRISGTDDAAGTSQDTNRDNLNVRVDYTFTDNNKVNFVYTREHNWGFSGGVAWPDQLEGTSWRDPRIMTVGYTSTLSPTVVNEFRFGYRQTSWHGRPAYADGCCLGDDELLTSTQLTEKGQTVQGFFERTPNGYPYLPNMQSLQGGGGVSGGSLWVTVPNFTTIRSQVSPLWQFGDTISFVMGSHSFQAGWEGTWADSNGWNTGGLEPRVNLGQGPFPITVIDSFTGLNVNDRNTARGMLNDLSGSVNTFEQTFVVNDPAQGFIDIQETIKQNLNFHQDDWATYFKDNWNVTSNLTLNYGVRWDVYGVPYEAKGLNVIATDNNYLGLSNPTNPGLTGFMPVGKHSPNPDIGTYDKDWNNVAPSFGFSYRVPWLDRATVVRGGYGISYSGAPTFLQYDFGTGRQLGKSDAVTVNPIAFTALPGGVGQGSPATVAFPLTPSVPAPFGTPAIDGSARGSGELYAYADNRRIPYIQNFNLSVETEVARDTNLSVAYLGTMGVALWGGQQINEPNIFATSNGETFLQAFNITRGGGQSAMFDAMLNGISLGAGTCGVVNGTTCTGSAALRANVTTDNYVADGSVGSLAEFITETNLYSGMGYGGLLRRNGFPENFLKANPQFGQVDLYDNSDASNYHALQAQVTKRLSNGFSGQFTYTWSKSMGNGLTDAFRARQDQSFNTRDPNNRALQWGLVGFHRTHQLNAHGVWNLPFGPGRALGSGVPTVVARVIEGWALSGIFAWDSGAPLNLTSTKETLGAENNTNTPDLVGAFPKSLGTVTVNPNGSVTYLDGYTRNTAATSAIFGADPQNLAADVAVYEIRDPSGNAVLRDPLPGTTGNLSTGWLTGPGRLQIDTAMEKSVQINEGTEFSIRLDAINLLNTPQWNNPNLNINSANFGQITGAGGARTFTASARIDF